MQLNLCIGKVTQFDIDQGAVDYIPPPPPAIYLFYYAEIYF